MTNPKTSVNEIQVHPEIGDDVKEKPLKLKYPKSVFFIIGNEFCERFSFYGIRTTLSLYLQNKVGYSENEAVAMYHIFMMLVYFFPLLGAMLADSLLGKFRTIFYVSIIYAVGQILLSLSAAPPIGLPIEEFSLLGLLLIAIGTGGIKPCVSAFGGDQFILPQQERYLSMFFSFFYFAINSGSFISSFLTPVLRSEVECFNEDCYSLAFFVPTVLMIISIVIFVLGKPLYKIMQPTGNVIFNVSKCVCCAIYYKFTSKEKLEHWLDYAEKKYNRKLIEDIKSCMRVLKMFLPLPLFWALFDQQGSRWTFQATMMDRQFGSFFLQPDHLLVVNPLLILIFIPLFETCIYPLCAKIKLINTPLKKLTTGGFLAAVSFIISALVELQLEKTYAVLPSQGQAQLRIFNRLDCLINVTLENESFIVKNLSVWEDKNVQVNGKRNLSYKANLTECAIPTISGPPQGEIEITEATALSCVITTANFTCYPEHVQKSQKVLAIVRPIFYTLPETGKFLIFKKDSEIVHKFATKEFEILEPVTVTADKYDIYLNDTLLKENVEFKVGGVYTVLGYQMDNKAAVFNTLIITEPNSVHILWLLPQYIVVTMAEVMFSVTGLEFAFTQAPASMKSLLQASWQLTVAVGNLIVVIVTRISFNSQVYEFILFAGLMIVVMLIFSVMSIFYKYVEPNNGEADIALEENNGNVNPSYNEDEKR